MECDQVDADNMLNINEPGSDSDDSTEKTPSRKKKRSSKTSREQFEKLLSFMKTHSDFTRRKADVQLTLDWEKCCDELNSMGQARYSPKKWRKVWSDYKGKKKGMASTSTTTSDQIRPGFVLTLPIDASSSHTGTEL